MVQMSTESQDEMAGAPAEAAARHPAPLNGSDPDTLEKALRQIEEYRAGLLGLARRQVPALNYALEVGGLIEEVRRLSAAVAQAHEARAAAEADGDPPRHAALSQILAELGAVRESVGRVESVVRGESAARSGADGPGPAATPETVAVNKSLLDEKSDLMRRFIAQGGRLRELAVMVCEFLHEMDVAIARAPRTTGEDMQRLRDVFVKRLENRLLFSFRPEAGEPFNPAEHKEAEGAAGGGGRVARVLLPGYRWSGGERDEVIVSALVEVSS